MPLWSVKRDLVMAAIPGLLPGVLMNIGAWRCWAIQGLSSAGSAVRGRCGGREVSCRSVCEVVHGWRISAENRRG